MRCNSGEFINPALQCNTGEIINVIIPIGTMQSIVESERGYVALLTWLRATFSRRDVLFGLAMAAAVWGAMPTFWEAFTPPDFSRNWRQDCDRVLIYQGLREAPRFRDTFKWWTGTWVGNVPFWRPLTSLLFWAEWRAFGWGNQDAWMLVLGLSHVLACAALFLFAEALVGSPAVGLFAVGLFSLPGLPSPLGALWQPRAAFVLTSWKNFPDSLLSLVALLALSAALKGMAAHASILAVAGACLKETGFLVVPAVIALGAHGDRRMTRLVRWVPLVAITTLLALLKLETVGAGFILGTNRQLGWRALINLCGRPVAVLLSPDAAMAILAGGIVCGALLRGWARWASAATLCLAALIAQQRALAAGAGVTDWDVAFAALLGPNIRFVAIPLAMWLFAAIRGLSVEVIIAAALFVCFGFPATLAPQVRWHAYHLAWACSAIAIATAWWNTWQRSALTWFCQHRHGRAS
ncbi:hypothetical protein [Pseudomonas sp.]|uniref:hypothetical protein n=1 Tax=Pseudomonas sp. TaxID=306 RepID=UPI003D0C04AE